ncbi:FecR/PupR family sigma factor regulator [Bradyrhizobium erythrophlei]|uniref:FecR/PupR family sigma factor regulator n=1 Tax=Bradyrhizobium erythrophlei TaxID=1437360 RepID=UPI0035EE4241
MSIGAVRSRPASVGKRWTVTKRSHQADHLDPLIREALSWILHLKSNEATLADAEQLIDWRARSPAHESAFRDAVKCWRAIGHALASSRPVEAARRRRSPKSKSRA